MNARTQKRKYGYHHINVRSYTAIVISRDPVTGRQTGAKFRNINTNAATVQRALLHFKRSFPFATHVNFYHTANGNFAYQEREFFRK